MVAYCPSRIFREPRRARGLRLPRPHGDDLRALHHRLAARGGGPTSGSNAPGDDVMTRKRAPLTYRDYLGLDTLLACQRCESAKAGRPAHDEHLFIIVHQTYELWFKQILFELDEVQRVFAGDVVDDRAIGSVVHG